LQCSWCRFCIGQQQTSHDNSPHSKHAVAQQDMLPVWEHSMLQECLVLMVALLPAGQGQQYTAALHATRCVTKEGGGYREHT
jgi:hypothetical protein